MGNPLRRFFEPDRRWKQLDLALSDAFEKVKAERMLVFSWLNYLRKKDTANDKLQQQVQNILGRHDEAIEELKRQLKEMREEARTTKNSPETNQVRTKSGPESGPVSGPIQGSGFVNRIVSMIRPQRKDYVMQKIMDLVNEGSRTTKQIETTIVREKGLCGRTAFYDYLKELRYKRLVKTGQKNGRKVLKIAEN